MHVTSRHGRPGRTGLALHSALLAPEERAVRDGIPVTSLPRTLLDLADNLDPARWNRAAEEAERLGMLQMQSLEEVCDRAAGRPGVRLCRELIEAAEAVPRTQSALEDQFAALCAMHAVPQPSHNVQVEDMEVDCLWPRERLIVELDGFAFHAHRTAFERDRARDTALQAAGYCVVRLTHRRLAYEAAAVAAEITSLLRSRA